MQPSSPALPFAGVPIFRLSARIRSRAGAMASRSESPPAAEIWPEDCVTKGFVVMEMTDAAGEPIWVEVPFDSAARMRELSAVERTRDREERRVAAERRAEEERAAAERREEEERAEYQRLLERHRAMRARQNRGRGGHRGGHYNLYQFFH